MCTGYLTLAHVYDTCKCRVGRPLFRRVACFPQQVRWIWQVICRVETLDLDLVVVRLGARPDLVVVLFIARLAIWPPPVGVFCMHSLEEIADTRHNVVGDDSQDFM